MPKKLDKHNDQLDQLLAALEREAPQWLVEALARKRISESRFDEWREIIATSVAGVRDAIERGDAVAAALAMHYAQKYASAALDLRRDADKARERASSAGKSKRKPKNPTKRSKARKLLGQMKPGASQRARAGKLMRKIRFKSLEAARNEVRAFDRDSG